MYHKLLNQIFGSAEKVEPELTLEEQHWQGDRAYQVAMIEAMNQPATVGDIEQAKNFFVGNMKVILDELKKQNELLKSLGAKKENSNTEGE